MGTDLVEFSLFVNTGHELGSSKNVREDSHEGCAWEASNNRKFLFGVFKVSLEVMALVNAI